MFAFYTSWKTTLFAVSFFFALHNELLAQTPDIILTNGKIFTADTTKLYVEAIAIRGNIIIATGSTSNIEKLASHKTKRIDLKGKTVVPGFNDAHDHLGWTAPVGLGYTYTAMTVQGLSKSAVLDSVAALVKKAKEAQWIHGYIGLDVFNDTTMKKALDSIAPNNPVLLELWWGHGLSVNSKALALSGIQDTAKDPLGGFYGRERGSNKLNGILSEYAQLPVWNRWLTSEPNNLVKGLQAYAQQQLSFGITSVQNMGGVLQTSEANRYFKKAALPVRTRLVCWPFTTTWGRNLADLQYLNTKPAPLTYFSGVKYLIDGTPIEGGALMKQSYNGRPGWHGRLDFPKDTIRQILTEAINSNTQLMMHIVGDSTFAIVLSLMKEIAPASEWRKKRVRIEHNSIRDVLSLKADIKNYGLMMMHTPVYAHNSPLKSLLKNNILIGISPDGTINPFLNLMIVTTQMARPEENLTREEAVIAYTYGNAYAEFAEDKKGTLAKGKLADLTVLSQDIFSVAAPQLPATRSVLTIVDGKIVYKAKSW